jgi:hypothetical protein
MFKVGDRILTSFLRGVIEEVIDGRTRRFWRPHDYFRIRVTYPPCARGTVQIVGDYEVRQPYAGQ